MWTAFGASCAGTGHRDRDLPCQDAHSFLILENVGVMAAVADGLGSAERSAEGARMAVDAALARLQEMLSIAVPANGSGWSALLAAALDDSRSAVLALADRAGAPSRQFGSTLMVAALTGSHLAVVHVGDGAVVGLGPGGLPGVVSGGVRGEYANETVSLTAPDSRERAVQLCCARPPRALALMTDGVQGVAMNMAAQVPWAGFFTPYWASLNSGAAPETLGAELATHLDSERYRRRTDDDKTILVLGRAWRPAPGDPA